MLEHIRTEHDLDYIMITGDYPAHDVWLQSRCALCHSSNSSDLNFEGAQPRHCPLRPGVAHRSLPRHPGGALPRQPRALPLQHVGSERVLEGVNCSHSVWPGARRVWRGTSSPRTGCWLSWPSCSPPGCPGPRWRASDRRRPTPSPGSPASG